MPPLENTRHEKFAQELAKGASQVDAYAAAGYDRDRRRASRLATNEDVRQRVTELQQAAADEVVISEAYVLSTIKETVERCRQVAPVLDRRGDQVFTETPDGEMAAAFVFDARSVLRGSELLGKHIGMFKDNPSIGNLSVTFVVERTRDGGSS